MTNETVLGIVLITLMLDLLSDPLMRTTHITDTHMTHTSATAHIITDPTSVTVHRGTQNHGMDKVMVVVGLDVVEAVGVSASTVGESSSMKQCPQLLTWPPLSLTVLKSTSQILQEL